MGHDHVATPAAFVYRRVLSWRWSPFGRKENVIAVTFDAATQRPRRWEVRVENPVQLGHGEGTIRRLELVLDVDADGWPVSETLDATGGLGLLALRVERDIRFRREPCAEG